MLGNSAVVNASAARKRSRWLWMMVHRWLGLSFGLVLLVAAVTGSAMLIADPLDKTLHSQLFQVPQTSSTNYQAVMTRLRAESDPSASFTLRPPRKQGESFQVIVRGLWSGTIYLDPATGEILGRRGKADGAMGFLFTLHSSLFAGEAGKAVLTLAALAYVIMLASGIYVWWPVRWRQALAIRWNAGGWRVLFDWHRVTGALFGVVVLVSVASGAYMAWPPLAKAVSTLSGHSLAIPPRVDSGPPKDDIVELAVRRTRDLFPNALVGYIQVPAIVNQPIRIRLRLPDDPHPNGLTSVWLDPGTAKVLQVNYWSDLDFGTRAYSYIYPLHTGELWGVPWLVVTFLMGLVLSIFAVTGLLLWWRRR